MYHVDFYIHTWQICTLGTILCAIIAVLLTRWSYRCAQVWEKNNTENGPAWMVAFAALIILPITLICFMITACQPRQTDDDE